MEAFDEIGRLLATLSGDDVIWEMAYFSKDRTRNTTVFAKTDLVIRRITSEAFQKMPTAMKISEKIAQGRQVKPTAPEQY